MNYRKIIQNIEEFYNIQLNQLPNNPREIDSAFFYKNSNSYNLDNEENIIQLNLNDNFISDLSHIGKITTLTHLSLSANNLFNIEELRNLPHLELLDLSSNQIQDIRPISNLKNLKSLRLDNNKIENLPLLNLLNLVELWMYSNNLREIKGLKKLSKLEALNLSLNKIQDVSTLASLKSIKHLTLDRNKINNIQCLSNIKKLIFLSLSYNQVKDISSLYNLEVESELILSNNLIYDLTPLYNSLKGKRIKSLSVENNPLIYPKNPREELNEKTIIDWFENNLYYAKKLISENKYSGEKKLDLGNCGITDLSMLPQLFECKHLEELILSNEYAVDKGGEWDRVKSANNHLPNNIFFLSNQFKNLINLKKLIIGGDWKKENSNNGWRIRNIKPLTTLINLEFLNVSNNQLERLPSLNTLEKLKTLHLNNNRIKQIFPVNLINLEELFLSNNRINSTNFLKDTPSIKTLDLHSNRVSDLSPLLDLIGSIGISDDKWKHNIICIQKNPLVKPSMDVVNLGKEAVVHIITKIEEGDSFINNEIKLILVGNSEAGKTTLAKYLRKDKDFKNTHPFTIWMDEMHFIFDKKFIRVFDFGGHDYYHDTHHLFFTGNCIYILLWEEETNKFQNRKVNQSNKENIVSKFDTQDFPINYWLDSIKYYTKEKEASNFKFEIQKNDEESSYSSSVIVVQNKAKNSNEIKFLNNKSLKEKYPFIQDFINIDIHSKRNLIHLEEVFQSALHSNKIIGEKFPKYFEVIKNNIGDYKGNIIMTLAKFHEFCNTFDNVEIALEDARILAHYLNNVGLILYNSSLGDIIYLQKSELRGLIVKLFEPLKHTQGKFNEDHIFKLTKNKDTGEKIIKLLIHYKLVFKLPQTLNEKKASSQEFIAPLYLPEQPNKLVNILLDKKLKPYRRFFYTGFINKNIILSLFGKYGENILTENTGFDNSYYWKNGLIIKNPKTEETIAIIFNQGNVGGNAHIDIIKLTCPYPTCFSDQLIKDIKEINLNYPGFEEAVTLDGFYYIKINSLINSAKKGERHIVIFDPIKGTEKYVSILHFNNYLPKNLRNKMKNAIISYSKADLDFVEEFKRTSLGPLETDGLLSDWYCTDLVAGKEWDEEIQKRIRECEIAFIMISSNSMNTRYIIENEIKVLLDRFEEGENKPLIIPIILKHYHWVTRDNKYNLGRFTALPYTAKPVSDFRDRELAWYMVGQCIRAAIENDIIAGDLTNTEYWKDYWTQGTVDKTMKNHFKRLIAGNLDNNS